MERCIMSTIMLVDDSATILLSIASILTKAGYTVEKAANAELALMKRWGMLDDGEMPEPNVNIRLAMDWLDRYADGMSLSILGTVIPMLVVRARSRITGISMITSTAKPTMFVKSAVRPAMKRRRKV